MIKHLNDLVCKKTETMAFHTTEEVMIAQILISLNSVPLKNVREFKYLGHKISNYTSPNQSHLTHSIASAFQKWNELKHVLTDNRIKMGTRVRFLEACVRSRLVYSIQAWAPSAIESQKLETIWHGFLRKMVRGGYQRKNEPNDENVNWSFKYSNAELRNITKTTKLVDFCEFQHLKFIAHVTRMPNSNAQKQLLFCGNHKKYSRNKWLKAKQLGISTLQAQKVMQNRKEFMLLILHRYNMQKNCIYLRTNRSNPTASDAMDKINDDDMTG